MRSLMHIWAYMRDTWQYRHEPEKRRVLADAYWRTLLFVAVLVLAGLVLYAGLKFYAGFGEGEANPLLSSGGGGILLNPADLESTVAQFEARKNHYEFLKRNPPRIADPSR